MTTALPDFLNSGLSTRRVLPTAVAKLTSVGGTSSPSKLPDMLSLPPMEAMPSPICASSAPSSAAIGLPQRSGCSPMCSKYSWKVRYISSWRNPAQTSLVTLSTTARKAPR